LASPRWKEAIAAVRLEAFLDAQDASDEDMRAARLQAHARQVRDHVGRLGSKAYWEALAHLAGVRRDVSAGRDALQHGKAR